MILCILFDVLDTLMNGEEFSKVDIKVLQCPNDLVVRKLRGVLASRSYQSSRKAYAASPD
jgi:hypothetical protein